MPRPQTCNDWTAALKRVKTALELHPKLGIPNDGGSEKMLLMYAWNEFGEGGMMAPTRGEKAMQLEAVCEVLGQ